MKPLHTDKVPYRWTAKDAGIRAGAPDVLPDDPKVLRQYYLTPYLVLPRILPGDKELKAGDLVLVPLDKSHERWSADRFFLDGYAWEPIPPQVTGYGTIGELCAALYTFSKDRYDLLNLAAQSKDQKNQTAKLIFDCWENCEYRYAIVKSGFDWEVLKDRTDTLTAEKGGVKILRVLTKSAAKGRSIKGVPAPKPPDAQEKPKPDDPRSRIVIEPDPFFSVAVTFNQATDGALTPLSGGKWRQSKLRFTVKIGKLKNKAQADETILRVVKPDGTVVHEETHTGDDFVKPGEHVWEWDGYSDAGVLDTRLLKTPDLAVEARVTALPGKAAVASAKLNGTPPADWVEVRINEPSKRVFVEVFLVPLKRFTSSISDSDFRLVMSMIEEGISKHWTRAVTVDGERWAVDVAARFRKDHGISYTIIETDDSKARSCNLRVVTTALSIWFYYCATVSLQEQRETAAHEFGHSILGTTTKGTPPKGSYGTHYSLTHKGSSTELQGQEPGAPSFPVTPAECDVMIYYNGRKTFDVYDRCFGVEDDVKHLIALSQVEY